MAGRHSPSHPLRKERTVLDFDSFHRAVHSADGLEAVGVDIPSELLGHLRAHDAYALAWFENWSRDGQPTRVGQRFSIPYAPSPDPLPDAYAVTGYAPTGAASGGSVAVATPPAPSIGTVAYAATPSAFPAAAHPQPPYIEATASPRGGFVHPDAPPPGWYPSPTSAGHEQWWNGASWTAERRPTRRRGFPRFGRR